MQMISRWSSYVYATFIQYEVYEEACINLNLVWSMVKLKLICGQRLRIIATFFESYTIYLDLVLSCCLLILEIFEWAEIPEEILVFLLWNSHENHSPNQTVHRLTCFSYVQ